MPITRRYESNLTPFFHLAVGRAEAKRNQEVIKNQYDYEDNAQLAQAFSDFSADQKKAYVNMQGGMGSMAGRVLDMYSGGMMGGGGGIPGGGAGLAGTGGGGGGGGGGGDYYSEIPRTSDVIDKPRYHGELLETQKPTTGPKLIDPTFGGSLDLSQPGDRAMFTAANRQNQAAIADFNRTQAADVAFRRKFFMEGLQSGALRDFARPGYTDDQKREIMGLQNARNAITHGTNNPFFNLASGFARMNPEQRRDAIRFIDSRMGAVLGSVGMVPLTPEERAAQRAGTTEEQFKSEVIEDGTRGMAKNQRGWDVLYDDAKELIDIENIIDERLRNRKYPNPDGADTRDWEDLTEEEQEAARAREYDRTTARVFGDRRAKQARTDRIGPGGGGDLRGTDEEQRKRMKAMELPARKEELEIGQTYWMKDEDAKLMKVIWTGEHLDPDLERGRNELNKRLDSEILAVESE